MEYNIILGSTGGYTGSYIFSHSIVSLRTGINSRLTDFDLDSVNYLSLLYRYPGFPMIHYDDA
jgi:hypothetical protein